MSLIAGEKTVPTKEIGKLVKRLMKEGHNVEVKYFQSSPDEACVVWGV